MNRKVMPRQPKPAIRRTADIDGLYRYSLTRDWSDGSLPVWAAFIGINPSIADGDRDDPTMRREVDFAARLGATALVKVNLSPFISTDPRHMVATLPIWRTASVVHRNNIAIQQAAALARNGLGIGVFAAWGVPPRLLLPEATRVYEMLGAPIMCLGVTKDGHPRHTLYLPKNSCPVEWRTQR